jgi:hypothetical protein
MDASLPCFCLALPRLYTMLLGELWSPKRCKASGRQTIQPVTERRPSVYPLVDKRCLFLIISGI